MSAGHSINETRGAAFGPPRSAFYRLTPMGMGTSEVESLGGYLARLADAHHLPFDALMQRGLVWFARGRPEAIGTHAEWRAFGSGRFVDSDPGGAVARAAAAATAVAGLEFLTLGPLRRTVSDRGLRAIERSWCPACYLESRHERLAWSIRAVTACSRHRTALTRRCSACGRGGSPYGGTVRVARCGYCGGDLARDDLGPLADQDAFEVAVSVADTLARCPNLAPRLSRTLVTERFRECCRRGGLTMVGACTRFAIPRATASAWWNGHVTPTLDKAIAIARLFGRPLGLFLAGEADPAPAHGAMPRVRRQRRRHRWAAIGRVLARHRDEQESVLAVARRMGVDVAEMRRRFPAECRSISRRACNQSRRRRRQWLAAEGRRLCAAVDGAVSAGATPTIRLAATVVKPGVLRDPALRARVESHVRALKEGRS